MSDSSTDKENKDRQAKKTRKALDKYAEDPESAKKCAMCTTMMPKVKCPCGKVRYCGASCQENHWSAHKATCSLKKKKPSNATAAVPTAPTAPVDVLDSEQCHSCGKRERENAKLLVCSKCKLAKYCTADCQKQHWKVHKPHCSVPSARAYNMPSGDVLARQFGAYGIPAGASSWLLSLCGRAGTISERDIVTELTTGMGNMMGQTFYKLKEPIIRALNEMFIKYKHPFLKFGSEVLVLVFDEFDRRPQLATTEYTIQSIMGGNT